MPIRNLNIPLNFSTIAALRATHLPIPPFPFQYQKDIFLNNGINIHVRPIRVEDEEALRRFFEKLSEKTVYSRFGQRSIDLSHDHLVKLCQVDYERDLPFVAVAAGDQHPIIGDARLNRLTNLEMAELSFVITDEWQGKGLGDLLMEFCISVAKEIGLKTLVMEVMDNNERMKQFGYKYGFQPLPDNEDDVMVEFQLKIDGAVGYELMIRKSTIECTALNSQAEPATNIVPLW